MTTLKEEEPFAAAVTTECLQNTCSCCFAHDGEVRLCEGCQVVSYCNETCQKSDWVNHKNECQILKGKTMTERSIPKTHIRLTMRILLKSEEQLAKASFNERTWNSLEDHHSNVKGEAGALFYQDVDFIMDKMKPLKNVSRDEVAKAFSKVITNSMEIFESSGCLSSVGYGVYLGLSIHKHSCVPDSQLIFTGTKASLRSLDEVAEYSSDLTITYTNLTPWSLDRKENVKKLRFFDCKCPICVDENHIMNRMGSSCFVSCCEDAAGILDENSSGPYRCSKCGAVSPVTLNDVIHAQNKIRNYLKIAEMAIPCGVDANLMITETLNIVLTSQKVLSVYNYLFLNLCESALEMSVKNEFYGMHSYLLDKKLKAMDYYLHETDRRRVLCLILKISSQYALFSMDFDDYQVLNVVERAYGMDHPATTVFRERVEKYSLCDAMDRARISLEFSSPS